MRNPCTYDKKTSGDPPRASMLCGARERPRSRQSIVTVTAASVSPVQAGSVHGRTGLVRSRPIEATSGAAQQRHGLADLPREDLQHFRDAGLAAYREPVQIGPADQ